MVGAVGGAGAIAAGGGAAGGGAAGAGEVGLAGAGSLRIRAGGAGRGLRSARYCSIRWQLFPRTASMSSSALASVRWGPMSTMPDRCSIPRDSSSASRGNRRACRAAVMRL